MMGMPSDFPSFIFGDNKSVLVNSTVPHSVLKKKSCSISYHFVREVVAYVDSDHEGDLLTRQSRIWCIVYLNNTPMYWIPKKQTSIETSSYGSEFTALKNWCEYLRGLKYKLEMMGIPSDFPSFFLGDNKLVLVNSTVTHSVLKKKSCSISYHFVHEGVANDEWRSRYIPKNDKRVDMLSKPLPGG